MSSIIFQQGLAPAPASARAVPARAAILDAIARTDPDKAKALKKEHDKLDGTLAQLNAGRSGKSAQKKEAARQKIEQIKAQLKALRYLAAANPKAAAQQAKHLARDLARAVKDFASAGGAASPGPMVPTPSPAETANPADITMTPPAVINPASTTGDTSQADIRTARTEQDAFARDARHMAADLKNIIAKARQKLRFENKNLSAQRDIDDARRSLADTDASLRVALPPPAAVASAAINMLV